jgi:hypothetical protein
MRHSPDTPLYSPYSLDTETPIYSPDTPRHTLYSPDTPIYSPYSLGASPCSPIPLDYACAMVDLLADDSPDAAAKAIKAVAKSHKKASEEAKRRRDDEIDLWTLKMEGRVESKKSKKRRT